MIWYSCKTVMSSGISTTKENDTPKRAAAALGCRVAAFRLAANLSQAELAARASVPLQTYKTFERTGRLTVDRLVAVMNVLGRQNEFEALLSETPVNFDEMWAMKRPKLRARATGRRKANAP